MSETDFHERYAVTHAALDALIDPDQLLPQATEALEQYYHTPVSHHGGFRSSLFDGYRDGGDGITANYMTPTDIASLSLLGLDTAVGAVLPALEYGDFYKESHAFLRAIPTDVALQEADYSLVAPDSPSGKLWSLVRELPGAGRVTAFKLLARKRPHLLPLTDTHTEDYMNINSNKGDKVWDAMWSWFQDPNRVAAVAEVRKGVGGIGHISLLRTLDVPMWMIQKGYVKTSSKK